MTILIKGKPMGMNRVPRLLSPIKSLEGAMRVIDAGADEIYCGVTIPELRKFSLFRGSFCDIHSYEELGRIVKYAHDHDVDVAVAINEPFMGEIVERSIQKHVQYCMEKEVDAMIIGDIGISSIVKSVDATIPLFASTYLASMNDETVEFLRKLGFSRVILERHLTLPEISELVKSSKIDIEIFVHGAGCSNINVDCYLFHFVFPNMTPAFLTIDGVKSPCTLPFEIYDVDNANQMIDKIPILDAYTFCSLCLLPELINKGIAGFKIEGRCLDEKYQETTTKIYHELMNTIASCDEKSFREKIRLLSRDFIPLPDNLSLLNLEELCCEQKRCYYTDLHHVPYKYPLSWQIWTKHQFKLIETE